MKPSEVHNQFLATGKSELCMQLQCHHIPSYDEDNPNSQLCGHCLVDCSPNESDGLLDFLHSIEDIIYVETDNT
jgi:hypothetical protein